MNSKDAYDIAAKIVDLMLKNLTMFIGICALFGGWIIVEGSVGGLSIPKRWLLIIIFSAATVTMIVGQYSLIRRASAALAVSQELFKQENAENDAMLSDSKMALFSQGKNWPTLVGMGAVVAGVDLLIYFAPLIQTGSSVV